MCGKVIGETPSGYCEACKMLTPEYSNLHKVKDFLYEYPNSTMVVVSAETGVSISEINKFIRDGAIIEISMVSENDGICSCGAPILGNGKLCSKCQNSRNKSIERVKKDLEKKNTVATEKSTVGFYTK